MFRQNFAGFLDAVNNAFCEFRFAEITGHSFRELLPKGIAAFFMDGLIANHREFMRARRDKNQHAIPMR